MKIKCRDLELILNRLSEFLKTYKEFEFDDDYYWDISEDEKYIFKNRPVNLHVGSLDDDNEELFKLLDKDRIFTPVDINRVSSILNKISHAITADKL